MVLLANQMFLGTLITLKDELLVGLIRGAVLWFVWLAWNKLCFQGVQTNPRSLGAQIISLSNFWANANDNGSKLKLSLMLPNDASNIPVTFDGLLVQEEVEGEDVAADLTIGDPLLLLEQTMKRYELVTGTI